MDSIPIFGYLVLCFLVGLRGTRTRVGYWGVVFLSIFFTPFLTFVALYLLDPEPRYTIEGIPTVRPK
jgi:hypothetical protein